ncbi:MAG TPA: DUF433 domain-containing protein [Phycisphaerae bacterium]
MELQVAYPHIDAPEGQCARLSRMPRIRVSQIVMDYLAHGWSAEEMCRQHPYLTLAEAHAAMGYYYDHQPQIDAEITAEWKAFQSKPPSDKPRSPFFTRGSPCRSPAVAG